MAGLGNTFMDEPFRSLIPPQVETAMVNAVDTGPSPVVLWPFTVRSALPTYVSVQSMVTVVPVPVITPALDGLSSHI